MNTPPSTTFDQEMRLFQDKTEDFVAHSRLSGKDWIDYEEIPGEVSEVWQQLKLRNL